MKGWSCSGIDWIGKRKHPANSQGVLLLGLFNNFGIAREELVRDTSESDRLEREDHVATDRGKARSVVFVESVASSVPNPADFWSEQQVRMGSVVGAHGEVVQIVIVGIAETGTAIVEPLKSITYRPAVVELVNQVVDVTESISSRSTFSIVRVENVCLADVGQLIGQLADQHYVLNTTALVGIVSLRLTETA